MKPVFTHHDHRYDTSEPYVALAIAVVKSAARDYRAALRRLAKNPDSRTAKAQKASLEEFFLSDYCTLLCSGLEGKMIIDRINKEIRK